MDHATQPQPRTGRDSPANRGRDNTTVLEYVKRRVAWRTRVPAIAARLSEYEGRTVVSCQPSPDTLTRLSRAKLPRAGPVGALLLLRSVALVIGIVHHSTAYPHQRGGLVMDLKCKLRRAKPGECFGKRERSRQREQKVKTRASNAIAAAAKPRPLHWSARSRTSKASCPKAEGEAAGKDERRPCGRRRQRRYPGGYFR